MNDISMWIALAALSFSIFGPFLTAILNNGHESIMYKKRFVEEHKYEVIEKYLKSAGKYAFTHQFEYMRDFGEASAEIFMYAPKELWDEIKELNKAIIELSLCMDPTELEIVQPRAQKIYFSLCEKFSDLHRSSNHKNK